MHYGTSDPIYPAFKALIDLLCAPLKLIDGGGRIGGVVGLMLGVGMLVGGWWATVNLSLLGLGACGLGLAYCAYGLSRLAGKEARLRRQFDVDVEIPEPLSRDALKLVLKSRPLPFFVCARCRVVMSPGDCGGRCLRCGSETDCVPVSDESDRKTAWASIY